MPASRSTGSTCSRRCARRWSASSTVWLVEDLHWADAATLELIRYLARRGEDSPALLLLTFRDDEVGANHPVRVLLGELATVRRVRRVDMRPLSRDAVAELARGSHVDLDALCERTGGNAFYVTEVLAGEDGVVPPTVRDAVLARASRLSPAAQDVLAAAAVIGFHVEIDVLATVSDQPLDALDDCLAAGVLRDGGTEVVFRHELAREAVAASLLPGRRRALHRAAYQALHGSARADDRRLAYHAASAGDGPSVIVHAPRAATLAAALGAHREAAEHYRAALRWGHLMAEDGRADLLERLSYECYLIGALPEASEARAAELALRRANGDTLRTGAALRGLSRVAWYRLRNAEAERYAREAVDTLAQLPAGTELAMAYSNMAQLRMLADDPDGTQEWGDRAVELARALGDLDTEVHALNNIGTALMIAGDPRGATILQANLDTALAHDLQEHVARAYTNISATHVKHRRYAMGEEVLQAGIAFCADRDLESWTSYMRGTRSILLLETGRWEEAGALAGTVTAHTVASVSRINALVTLGRLGTRTGARPGGRRGSLGGGRALGRGPAGADLRVRDGRGGLDKGRPRRHPPPGRRGVGPRGRARRPVGRRRAALVAALRGRGPCRAPARGRAVRADGRRRRARRREGVGRHREPLLGGAGAGGLRRSRRPAGRRVRAGSVGRHRHPGGGPARPAPPRHTGAPGTASDQPCQPGRADRARDGGAATRSPKASPTRRSRAASSCRRRRWRTTCPRCCASSRSPRVPAPSPPPGRWA